MEAYWRLELVSRYLWLISVGSCKVVGSASWLSVIMSMRLLGVLA